MLQLDDDDDLDDEEECKAEDDAADGEEAVFVLLDGESRLALLLHFEGHFELELADLAGASEDGFVLGDDPGLEALGIW